MSFSSNILRLANRRYLSDVSYTAIGGFCPELKVFWRYDLPPALTKELKSNARFHKTCSITNNLLKLARMTVTAWIMQELVGGGPYEKCNHIIMRGANMPAVSWVNRCGGAKNKRAGVFMKMLGRLKIMNGWCHIAKHAPGVDNIQADGISRWPRSQVQHKIKNVTGSTGWVGQDIRDRGRAIIDLTLSYRLADKSLNETVWNLMSSSNH